MVTDPKKKWPDDEFIMGTTVYWGKVRPAAKWADPNDEINTERHCLVWGEDDWIMGGPAAWNRFKED